ncbi:MAG: MopE-related protein [Nanoarchaeota archaeon]
MIKIYQKRGVNVKGQASIENIILVGIVLAILVPSILIFYKSITTPEAQKSEVVSIGNNLVTQIKNLQASGDGSWQTVTFTYRGGKGRIFTENGNELIITTDQAFPFFLQKDENLVIEEDLVLKTGKNRIKLTNQEGIICVSSSEGTCNYTLCRDDDLDYFSKRGKGSCCGPSGDSVCGDEPDCRDDDMSIHPGALEACNRIDDNCNGLIDEDFDQDHDGYPAEVYYSQCQVAYGGIENFDCDDTDPNVNPGMQEICDGKDNDCNRLTDEYLSMSCADAGYKGLCALGTAYCNFPDWDCDRSPIDEICDDNQLVDEDCDGYANNLDPDCWELFFADYDHIEEGVPNEWLFADTCKGNCEPLETENTVQVAGINNTSVSIPTGAKLKYDASNNVNLAQGTVQFWVRSNAPNIWNDDERHVFFLLKKEDVQQGNHNQVIINKDNYNNLWLKYQKGPTETTWQITQTEPLIETAWYLFTLTWDTATASLNFYVNDNHYPGAMATNSWPGDLVFMSIGADVNNGNQYSDFAQARIDNLLIYNQVKSLDQVTADYEAWRWDYEGECTAPGGIGDVNANGCVDGDDRYRISRYLSGYDHPADGVIACMDINQDRKVDQIDYDLIVPEFCQNCMTPLGECYDSGANPLYCTEGAQWTQNCQLCGCPDNRPVCQPAGHCTSLGGSPVLFKEEESEQ